MNFALSYVPLTQNYMNVSMDEINLKWHKGAVLVVLNNFDKGMVNLFIIFMFL